MKFTKKRYVVNGWRGKVYSFTAKELYERVMEDSKSNYNWITSATELVKICDREEFPQEYAKEIKIAILNCFASLEIDKSVDDNFMPTDNDAVYYCYNSLFEIDEKVEKTKQNYLVAVIKSIVLNHFELPIHYGPIYKKTCNDWIKSKFDENINREKIDFKNLKIELHEDFKNIISAAEKEGVFKEEDEQSLRKYRITVLS